jgi:hypothetical protein
MRFAGWLNLQNKVNESTNKSGLVQLTHEDARKGFDHQLFDQGKEIVSPCFALCEPTYKLTDATILQLLHRVHGNVSSQVRLIGTENASIKATLYIYAGILTCPTARYVGKETVLILMSFTYS